MDSVRVDLQNLHELRDNGTLGENDRKFVIEMAKLLEDGKGLDRHQILRIVDLCRDHLHA
jgi:hypothetical protein